MDNQVLIASAFERRHVLGVLRVLLQRFGDAISFDDLFSRYVSRTKFLDCSLETAENRLE